MVALFRLSLPSRSLLSAPRRNPPRVGEWQGGIRGHRSA